MNISDLAKEVADFNMLRDRPSPLILTLKDPWPTNSDALFVLAPIVNGRNILTVSLPERDSAVDFDASNVEAVAVLIESKMLRAGMQLILSRQREDRTLQEFSSWRFDTDRNADYTQRALRIQEIKQILSVLFV